MPFIISEQFVDEFGTKVITRIAEGNDHVQLLMIYKDGSEPTSYGFTKNDFKRFCKQNLRVDEAIS